MSRQNLYDFVYSCFLEPGGGHILGLFYADNPRLMSDTLRVIGV